MNDTLEPLPKDIADKLATLVPPPMPPSLAASLLPGIHAAAGIAAGAGIGAGVGAAAAAPWWLARVPLWVPVTTLVVGALGGAGVARVVSTPPPAAAVQTAAPPVAEPPPEAIVVEPPKEQTSPPTGSKPLKIEAPAAATDHLREERVLIEAARAAMSRNPEEGLVALQQHERAFPRGQLREEREALAVQLLLRLGRVQAAKARFDAFARAFPKSALLGVLGAAFATIDAGR